MKSKTPKHSSTREQKQTHGSEIIIKFLDLNGTKPLKVDKALKSNELPLPHGINV
jgi:hypothetical protein